MSALTSSPTLAGFVARREVEEVAQAEVAERVGFEPTVEFPLHTLSKRAPSTTRTSLRFESQQLASGRGSDYRKTPFKSYRLRQALLDQRHGRANGGAVVRLR
jgi:hypothetical protein